MESDLCDGVLLCLLLEILSNKTIKFNPSPKNDMVKRENCQRVVDFIKSEGIRLENIGAGDIFSGSLKVRVEESREDILLFYNICFSFYWVLFIN